MSTAAERAAIRILQAVPREAIHTHYRPPPIQPTPGVTRASPEQAEKLRARMVELRAAGHSYRAVAKMLEVPVYVVNNYLRVTRGYKWTGKRK